MEDVQEKPKDIIQFTATKLSVGEVSQLVVSPLCGAVSLFVGEFVTFHASAVNGCTILSDKPKLPMEWTETSQFWF